MHDLNMDFIDSSIQLTLHNARPQHGFHRQQYTTDVADFQHDLNIDFIDSSIQLTLRTHRQQYTTDIADFQHDLNIDFIDSSIQLTLRTHRQQYTTDVADFPSHSHTILVNFNMHAAYHTISSCLIFKLKRLPRS
ncbi:hypothetical protein DPMN_024611 [Dreissena polymorpha]|uniref:Uncharacterized protein n=1 Tax=Dreissena polymorpha TaxID=45954 RepID=A0A9D4RCH2_DREPO|nr:hypothetical protein DPMN_024611 [Dreissena polymorpha]